LQGFVQGFPAQQAEPLLVARQADAQQPVEEIGGNADLFPQPDRGRKQGDDARIPPRGAMQQSEVLPLAVFPRINQPVEATDLCLDVRAQSL
jgi:hypothetical protein